MGSSSSSSIFSSQTLSQHGRTFHVIVPRIANLLAATVTILFGALSVHVLALGGHNDGTLGIKKGLDFGPGHVSLDHLGPHDEKFVHGLLDATVVATFGNGDGSVQGTLQWRLSDSVYSYI